MEIATSTSNPLRRFLLSFSWRRNFEILFSDLPNDCVNDVNEIAGLRVICLLWISMVHVCTVLYYISGKIHIIIKQNQKHSKSNDQFNQFFVLFTEQIFGFFFSFVFFSDNKMFKNRSDSSNIFQGILNSGSLAIDTHFFLWYSHFQVHSCVSIISFYTRITYSFTFTCVFYFSLSIFLFFFFLQF